MADIMCVLVAQLCLNLCDPMDCMDCSLSGSSVHGILQARILEWVSISFSRDLHDPRIEPTSPVLAAEFFFFFNFLNFLFSNKPPGEPQHYLDESEIQRTWNLIIENLFKLVTTQIPTLPPKSILE